MFLKLDQVFAPLSFIVRGELEISFSTYFITHTYWFNSFLFK